MLRVPLHGRGYSIVGHAIIDECDAGLVLPLRWHRIRSSWGDGFYAASRKKGQPILRMHRLIMTPPTDMEVDHINGDGLDNRRSNLRLASDSQNNCNRRMHKNNKSGFKGVRLSPLLRTRPWRAVIYHKRKQIDLGTFATAEDAHGAYCAAAEQLHGRFARFS